MPMKYSARNRPLAAGVVQQILVVGDLNALLYNQTSYPTIIGNDVQSWNDGSELLLQSGISNITGATVANVPLISSDYNQYTLTSFTQNITSISGSYTGINNYPTSGSIPAFEIDIGYSTTNFPIYMGVGNNGSYKYQSNGTTPLISATFKNLFFSNILYSYGYLGTINRNHITKMDAVGNVTSWNPSTILNPVNLSGPVNTIILNNNLIYIGGLFNTIGGVNRTNVGCVDNNLGNVTAWNPNCNNYVNIISASGSNIYLGGAFTNVNGTTRNYAAAVDINNNLLQWNPNCDSYVFSIACNNNLIYLGGSFLHSGSQIRNYISCVDSISGYSTTWNPICDNTVYSIVTSSSNIYFGGLFTSINSVTRNYVACVDTSANLLPWNPNCNNVIFTITPSSSNIYLGGKFTTVGGVIRNRVACIDTSSSGNLLPWNPNCNNDVETIITSANNIYLGGSFTTVGGTNRNYMACVDNISGTLLSTWNTSNSVTAEIYTMALSANYFFIGGSFNSVGAITSQITGNLSLNNSITQIISGNGVVSNFQWQQN